MLKNISILSREDNASRIAEFVEEAINKARYKGQLQFIFFIEKKKESKSVNKMVTDLYMKYPPDIFDSHPLPTIKAVVDEDTTHWDLQCAQKADAPIVLFAEEVEILMNKHPQDWDMHYLDTEKGGVTPRKAHGLKIMETV